MNRIVLLLVISILTFFLCVSFPASSEDRKGYLVKVGIMIPSGIGKDKLQETRIITMDPSRGPGFCFLVDPPNSNPYEVYSVHYLPAKPTTLTGDFKNRQHDQAVTGIKTVESLNEGIRPFCFEFHDGDPLGKYRIEIFINGKLTENLVLDVIAP